MNDRIQRHTSINLSHYVLLTLVSLTISSSVRCLMNTGLPLHFTVRMVPTGILLMSNSAEAKANTSAVALILDTNYDDVT